jgi:hypothetical protein
LHAPTRRDFIYGLGASLGSVAFSALMAEEAKQLSANSQAHFPGAKAKNVIFLMMEGGPSHIDTFDPKPKLEKLHLQAFVREAGQWDYSSVGAFPIRGVWNLNLHYTNQQYLEFMYEEPSKRHPMWQRSSDWYDHIFGDQPFPASTVDVWGHGPMFSASKELIRRHPKSVYEYLMETYHSPYNRKDEKWNVNPTHDLFGRFWKVLFTHNTTARVKPTTPHSGIEPAPGPLPAGVKWVSPNPDALRLRVLQPI